MCVFVGTITITITMLGVNTTTAGAQHATIYNIYKNIKLNVLKTNTAIWFNNICRTKQLAPK